MGRGEEVGRGGSGGGRFVWERRKGVRRVSKGGGGGRRGKERKCRDGGGVKEGGGWDDRG